MKDKIKLSNFPNGTMNFLKQLEKNNSRKWFEENRDKYEELFLKPAQEFVETLGLKMHEFHPEFNAIPKIDKSIFRLHRDVRFSKDKSPYKTNLGILIWQGSGKKMESSGLYFHIDSKKYMIATGMYMFTKEQLNKYREVILDLDKASELNDILTRLKKKNLQIGGENYKKLPREFPKDYKFDSLAKHNGVYAYVEGKSEELNTKDPIKLTISTFKKLFPLHNWIVENLY